MTRKATGASLGARLMQWERQVARKSCCNGVAREARVQTLHGFAGMRPSSRCRVQRKAAAMATSPRVRDRAKRAHAGAQARTHARARTRAPAQVHNRAPAHAHARARARATAHARAPSHAHARARARARTRAHTQHVHGAWRLRSASMVSQRCLAPSAKLPATLRSESALMPTTPSGDVLAGASSESGASMLHTRSQNS